MTNTELLEVCNNYRKEMDKLFTEWKEKQGCIDLKIKKSKSPYRSTTAGIPLFGMALPVRKSGLRRRSDHCFF